MFVIETAILVGAAIAGVVNLAIYGPPIVLTEADYDGVLI